MQKPRAQQCALVLQQRPSSCSARYSTWLFTSSNELKPKPRYWPLQALQTSNQQLLVTQPANWAATCLFLRSQLRSIHTITLNTMQMWHHSSNRLPRVNCLSQSSTGSSTPLQLRTLPHIHHRFKYKADLTPVTKPPATSRQLPHTARPRLLTPRTGSLISAQSASRHTRISSGMPRCRSCRWLSARTASQLSCPCP